MSIEKVYVWLIKDITKCGVPAVSKLTSVDLYLVSTSCGVDILVCSGNDDYDPGRFLNITMTDIQCSEPTSDWKIRIVNKDQNCKLQYKIQIYWDCLNPASSISSKCMLRKETTIPPLPSPIRVGDQVVATVDLLDSPTLPQYPVVNVTTNLSYTAMPSIPAVLSTVGKHEINFTITSPGTHQICLDIETKQFLELGTTCRNITVNPIPSTIAPTAIPTVVPTVVPTEVPTAIPTEVPTAIPTVVPTAEPIPPTAVPNTTVPETEIPSTGIPTSIPTEVPILSTSEPSTSAPSPTPTNVPVAFGSTTAGGAAIGAVLAGSGAGGSLSKTMVIVNQTSDIFNSK